MRVHVGIATVATPWQFACKVHDEVIYGGTIRGKGGPPMAAIDGPAGPSMAAIDGPAGPSMVTKSAVDGPAGPSVPGGPSVA